MQPGLSKSRIYWILFHTHRAQIQQKTKVSVHSRCIIIGSVLHTKHKFLLASFKQRKNRSPRKHDARSDVLQTAFNETEA